MEDIPTLTRDGYLITFEILKKVCKVGWEKTERIQMNAAWKMYL